MTRQLKEGQLQCSKCKIYQNLGDFPKAKKYKHGVGSWCKKCTNERNMVNYLKRKYGITIEQYNEMLNKQNNVCVICHRESTFTPWGTVKGLSVDHCHTTGKVRGLLCSSCNVALGYVEDNPEILRQMIKYLEGD